MLRVASYNIRHGADVRMNMQILADDMTGLNLDVVSLQEVDQGVARSGGIDTMKSLSAASGMAHYAFARGISLGEGEYGTGILSRWPILSFTVTALVSGTAEQRSIGHAVLDVNGREVHFLNTHLSYEKKALRTRPVCADCRPAAQRRAMDTHRGFQYRRFHRIFCIGQCNSVQPG